MRDLEHRCDRSGESRAPSRDQAGPGAPAPRGARTGMEPFLLAAVIGLGIWALLLAPFLL